ncbi:MAG: NAD(P)-dependent oxidoreductase [Candidatus Bathyarchaeia archaeon]|jgi:D-3-phosphoglycerate dehydrogenase
MKVLLNDGMDEEGVKLFENAGIEVDKRKRDPQALVEQAGEFDALVVRSATKITREMIEAGSRGKLKVIGRAGVGTDNIDVKSATEYGVIVKSAPFGNTNATAELALALMLDVSRRVPQGHYSLKRGVWRKKCFEGTELSGKTLGIIGCGRIGQKLSELVVGFSMETLGYDPIVKSSSRIKFVSKEEVLTKADYVSIHVSGNENVIGEKELMMMKPSAYLVNTSRGRNVDAKALYKALKEGRIAGAALDVFEDEPAQEDSEFKSMLRQLDNIVFTPHLGASTVEAQRKTSVEMARVIIDYLLHGDFSNAVNVGESIELEQKPFYPLFVYHADKPGMFAKIDKVLADFGVNIRENPSRQIGVGCAIAVYLVHQRVGQDVIDELNKLEGVIRAIA